jgi:hypothetical protein
MSYPIATDIIRRIQNEGGHTLDVRPWPDGPDFVCLMNSSDESAEWFGRIELSMEPEFARRLGRALIACADELDKALRGEEK